MLIPSITQLQTLGYQKRIQYVIGKIFRYCLLLGGSCLVFFLFSLENFLEIFLFHSQTAGIYIHTMSYICPFLYLNTTLTSVLNGLGKSGICLLHSVISVCIRISFVLFAIPVLESGDICTGFSAANWRSASCTVYRYCKTTIAIPVNNAYWLRDLIVTIHTPLSREVFLAWYAKNSIAAGNLEWILATLLRTKVNSNAWYDRRKVIRKIFLAIDIQIGMVYNKIPKKARQIDTKEILLWDSILSKNYQPWRNP